MAYQAFFDQFKRIFKAKENAEFVLNEHMTIVDEDPSVDAEAADILLHSSRQALIDAEAAVKQFLIQLPTVEEDTVAGEEPLVVTSASDVHAAARIRDTGIWEVSLVCYAGVPTPEVEDACAEHSILLLEMGDIVGEEVPVTENRGFSDFRLSSKLVMDNVHGFIPVDQLALQFVDTEQFQRLRDLKQLGLTHMVYPGAVHSRFEHSLGVYHLAGETVDQLKKYQGPELGIDDFDVQTVKLAGLLHDVGHGPFSHMFESGFLPNVLQGSSEWSHEDMSLRLVDYIVDEHHIEIDESMLKKVKEMIVASTAHASKNSLNGKRFLYDIVANGRNGIDVDKFDYIVRDSRACGLGCSFKFERLMQTVRVMDDEICYRAKEYLTINKLFLTRADLHRTVYTHAKVKGIEIMVIDALLKADSHLQISSMVNDPAEFWKLDDTILKRIETDTRPELKEARDLILRIRRRDLYQFCNEFTVPKDRLEHFKNVTPQQIVCSQDAGDVPLKEDDVAVSNIKIDLTQGTNNPLKSIRFFQNYDSTVSEPIEDDRISHLLPACCQDRIVRVYAKKPELVSAVSKAFENLQEKTFWKKVQVHPTPEKNKKRRKI